MRVREATTAERLKYLPESPDCVLLFAEEDGLIHGQVGFTVVHGRFVVHDMACSGGHEAVVLGKRLIREARKQGFDRLTWGVDPERSTDMMKFSRGKLIELVYEMKI